MTATTARRITVRSGHLSIPRRSIGRSINRRQLSGRSWRFHVHVGDEVAVPGSLGVLDHRHALACWRRKKCMDSIDCRNACVQVTPTCLRDMLIRMGSWRGIPMESLPGVAIDREKFVQLVHEFSSELIGV